MSKRMTDTEKWQRPWFRKLPVQYKAVWLYILDTCDIAGIWYVDFELLSFCLGVPTTYEETLSYLQKQIKVLNGGSKWFVHDYVMFQCGKLNTSVNFHRAVIERLRENNLTLGEGVGVPVRHYIKGDINKTIYIGGVHFDTVWTLYPSKIGKKRAEKYFYATVQTEEDFEKMKKALENYKKSDRVKKNFIQNASTWFNNWEDWIDDPITNEGEQQKIRYATKSVDAQLERIAK